MRNIIVLLILILSGVPVIFSQESKVEKFSYYSNDLSSRTKERLDLNGNRCALLKIISDDKIRSIHGNTIGEIENLGYEKWVYMSKGSKTIKIFFESSKPLHIEFLNYGISNLSNDGSYELIISNNIDRNSLYNSSIEDALQSLSDGYYSRTLEICQGLKEQNLPKVNLILSYLYYNGLGVIKDVSLGIEYLKMAANGGDDTALCNLGYHYEKGINVNLDKSLAFNLYHKAAEKNNVIAQYNLGNCYNNGIGTGINKTNAYRWFKNSAEQDYTDAIAMQIELVFPVLGVNSQSMHLQDSLSNIAANRNHVVGLYNKGRSLQIKGEYYKDKTTINQALILYLEAANRNYALAAYMVGSLYYNGAKGIKRDNNRAYKYMLKASELGYPDASYILGCMYNHGEGVSKNEQQKRKYWKLQRDQEEIWTKNAHGLGWDSGSRQDLSWISPKSSD